MAAGPEHTDSKERFDKTFSRVAASLGIKLAPRDGPSTVGTIFGVHYDTVDWTWAVPQARLDKIINMIWDVLEMDSIPAKLMESLVGKIINVRPLVPDSRFHINQLQLAISFICKEENFQKATGVGKPIFVKKTEALADQLQHWRLLLPACSGRIAIPSLSSCIVFRPVHWSFLLMQRAALLASTGMVWEW